MKVWQKIALGASAGLLAAYMGAKGCDVNDYRQDILPPSQPAQTSSVSIEPLVEPVKLECPACPEYPAFPKLPDYSCICNCPPVSQQDCPSVDCPDCPTVNCPECPSIDCPACPECKQQQNAECETVEQAINRIIANEEDYTGLIRRLVEEHPCLVISYLPKDVRAELGGDYIKHSFREGYHKMSKGLRRLLRKGERHWEDW
ncbi:hypothetical protein ACFL96_10885 [Thermoproteota archaeon]